MSHFTNDFNQFFKELAANNSTEWFHANKKRYEGSVKKPFTAFITEMITRISEDDPTVVLEAKDAIMRINRDIRFSADKSPYKTHMSAIISAGGKKDKTVPGIYLELNPEEIRIYGGAHLLEKEQLQNVREAIARDPKGINKLMEAKGFKEKFGTLHGEKNKQLPAEWKEVAESQPLLFNKQFYYYAKLSTKLITDPKLPEVLMEHYHAGKAMNAYLAKAMAG